MPEGRDKSVPTTHCFIKQHQNALATIIDGSEGVLHAWFLQMLCVELRYVDVVECGLKVF